MKALNLCLMPLLIAFPVLFIACESSEKAVSKIEAFEKVSESNKKPGLKIERLSAVEYEGDTKDLNLGIKSNLPDDTELSFLVMREELTSKGFKRTRYPNVPTERVGKCKTGCSLIIHDKDLNFSASTDFFTPPSFPKDKYPLITVTVETYFEDKDIGASVFLPINSIKKF